MDERTIREAMQHWPTYTALLAVGTALAAWAEWQAEREMHGAVVNEFEGDLLAALTRLGEAPGDQGA